MQIMAWSLVIAYGAVTSLIVGCVVAALTVPTSFWWWWRSRGDISVYPDHVRIGRYSLELSYIADVHELDADAFAQRVSTGLKTTDVRLVHRPRTAGVEVFLNDVRDPHRVWLVSSQKPTDLVRSLRAGLTRS
jgi:hypothetical protein